MMRSIFILVPSPHATGPVKGAFALANALAPFRRVAMIYLREGPGVDAPLDASVEEISLAAEPGGWYGRLNAYRRILSDAGGRDKVVSISMCLSADLLNRFCKEEAVICASVRGNLPQNYWYDYGVLGVVFSVGHLLALRSFDHVVAMTNAMARQIRYLTGINCKVIGNFVDEQELDLYRQTSPREGGSLRFVFVGSLTARKQPELIVQATEDLRRRGHDVQLDMIGDGPLRRTIENTIFSRGLREHIRLHGQLANPYPLMAASDAFVLPSRSEGVSRAALEALHLGVPCVLRSVDGNGELLSRPRAGTMFFRDGELSGAMFEVARDARTTSTGTGSLLPSAFRQAEAASQYLILIEGVT